MSKPINFRIVAIGDFSDGSLVINKKRVRFANAAVIEFQADEDAQKFARMMTKGYEPFRVEKLTDQRRPPAAPTGS